MEKKEKNTNSLGYKMGYALGTVIIACLMVTIIALTVKYILWLF